jgi:hypothetical protein
MELESAPAGQPQHLDGLVLLWTARRMVSIDGIAVLGCQPDELLPFGDRSGFGAGGTGGGDHDDGVPLWFIEPSAIASSAVICWAAFGMIYDVPADAVPTVEDVRNIVLDTVILMASLHLMTTIIANTLKLVFKK